MNGCDEVPEVEAEPHGTHLTDLVGTISLTCPTCMTGVSEATANEIGRLRAACEQAVYAEQRTRELLEAPDMLCVECGSFRDDCSHPYYGEEADPWQHVWQPPAPVSSGTGTRKEAPTATDR